MTGIMRHTRTLLLILPVIATHGLSEVNKNSGKHLWQEDILDPKKYLEKIYEYYVAGRNKSS